MLSIIILMSISLHGCYKDFTDYFINNIQKEEDCDNSSTSQISVQKHLPNVAEVRQRAESISKKAAVKMVEESSSKHPPAEYAIGSKVLVRRFSSMSRKKAGKESASKNSRVVQGTISKRSQKAGTYRIL